MLTSHDQGQHEQAVIVELKQWSDAKPSSIDDCVTVFMGGRLRDLLHPSAQVGGYERYLMDVHTAFSEGEIGMASCAFAHNATYDEASELWASSHRNLLERWPLFAGD